MVKGLIDKISDDLNPKSRLRDAMAYHRLIEGMLKVFPKLNIRQTMQTSDFCICKNADSLCIQTGGPVTLF